MLTLTWQQLAHEFASRFGAPPDFVARAPGRVNLIGEHTDYNDGFVLPMAINRHIEVYASPRTDSMVNLYSKNFDQVHQFDLSQSLSKTRSGWFRYVEAVAHAMQASGYALTGFDGLVAGNIPLGSGLSSSAALEVACVLAFVKSAQLNQLQAIDIARLAQRAEFEFVGVKCGLMDQFISAAGIEGHALKVDCRDMTCSKIAIPSGVSVVVGDTKLDRNLAESAYNQRRQECEAGLAWLNENTSLPAGVSMRDLSLEWLLTHASAIPAVSFRRLRHVVSENQRVHDAADALRHRDLARLGQLINASHNSLRDDYEVSSEGLDVMVSCMRSLPGCYGARLTGAGFGGCAIALVDQEQQAEFVRRVSADYRASQGISPDVFVAEPSEGGRIFSV